MAFKTCAAFLAAGLGLLMSPKAAAQTPPTAFPGDWPNLGAFNNRQGANGDPATYGSGRTELRWLTPNTAATRNLITLDNTDQADQTNPIFVGTPYDPPPANSVVSEPFPGIAAWPAPPTAEKEASSPYLKVRRAESVPGLNRDLRSRTPSYSYATCTPSARSQSDPTVPQTASALKYFTWNFVPDAGTERNYALYAWLPIGPTNIAPGSGTDRRFPQRYFVYEIRFGQDRTRDGGGLPDGIPDQRYIDIVDINVSGGGFVRLGGGGYANQAIFPSSGTAIRVRLFNTVPRNGDGSLAIEGSTTTMSDAAEANLAASRLVYADAAEVRPQPGQFLASPTAATMGATPTLDWHVTAALNEYVPGLLDGTYRQATSGTVINYQANPARWPNPVVPQEIWRYSLLQESPSANTTDNGAAGVTFDPGWATGTASPPRHIGGDYRETPVTLIDPDATPPTPPGRAATYAPDLSDGSYAIYAYVPGDTTPPTNTYSRSVRYWIFEGGSTPIYVGTMDQTVGGWVRLGNRRYENLADTAKLSVVITNLSDAADTGRRVFADAVRFVSAADIGIASSPVHATALVKNSAGATLETKVVLVLDESGKIHCLDEAGRGDGTTTEYWSYPSTPNYNDADWVDKNLSEVVAGAGDTASGIDGKVNPAIQPERDNAPTATMPTSFDLSTALVARVGGADYLYVAATNGRIYCIEMAGRGDYVDDATRRIVGSTKRQWTFPNDYDPTKPTDPIGTSSLGGFRGSIVFGDTAQGAPGPTIYAAAPQGRVYALDATVGRDTRTTVTRWVYPSLEQPTTPPISMTPTLFRSPDTEGTLFFGTQRNFNDDSAGQFYALNASNGKPRWRINGPAITFPPEGEDDAAAIRIDAPTLGAFVAGPVAVPKAQLDIPGINGVAATHFDTVYAMNDNGVLYGFRADNGQQILFNVDAGDTFFATDAGDLTDGNLTFTTATVYNRAGILDITKPVPVIVIPGINGQLTMMFARPEDYNDARGYLAGFNDIRGNGLRSAAASNGFLFTADDEGGFYAFDNVGGAGGNYLPFPAFDPGVSQGIPPNDPRGRAFRRLKLKLINKTGYVLLKDVDSEGKSTITYDQAVNQTTFNGPANPYAFEWGETAYVLVYGFPYDLLNENNQPVAPPQVTITLRVEGKSSQQKQSPSSRFADDGPPIDGDPDGRTQSGYAVTQFTFQNAGSNALPPGNGQISASISTAAFGTSATASPQPISSYTRDALSVINFTMANPLRIEVYDLPGSNIFHGLGADLNAGDASNAVNGSPDLPGDAVIESQLLASAGMGQHGGTATAKFRIYDRSLMVLVRPEGLNNVRVQRTNAQRQGGNGGIYDPLDATLYPRFEDRPVNFPNNSLDYPNIGREQVRVVKDPGGNAENPLLTPVSLKKPVANLTNGPPLTEDNLGVGNDRTLVPTPFDLPIDIPRYQPPVFLGNMLTGSGTDNPNDLLTTLRHNSAKQFLPQGYFGRVQVYIDSTGDGRLNTDTTREAYRAFNYSVGVQPQMSIQVGTPNVDLGSLAAGTGYATMDPATNGIGGLFSPWPAASVLTPGPGNSDTDLSALRRSWKSVYQPFSVRNDGNVNLTNLRLAKATNDTGAKQDNRMWAINPSSADPLAWLGAALKRAGGDLDPGSLWSNIDAEFATPYGPSGNVNKVILPKPRVTDRVPTELVANPYPRANPNTGANGAAVNADGSSNSLNTQTVPIPFATPTSALQFTTGAPRVGVSVPLGFPVGDYSTQMRVVQSSPGFNLGESILEYDQTRKIYEAYSDPITLTFKIRETRATNRVTPRTAPMLDDPSLLPIVTPPPAGAGQFRNRATYRNAAPAAMRDTSGSLVVAWESDEARNRNAANANAINPSLIYLASLDNEGNFNQPSAGAPAGNSPLWDLSKFKPVSNVQWFKKYAPGGYPLNGAALFAGGTVDAATVRFGSPSFPAKGTANPLVPQGLSPLGTAAIMGFVGEAQVGTNTGRLSQSKVFVTPVPVDGNGEFGTLAARPAETLSDPLTAKGKPSVLQLTTGALVFYSETSAGTSGITMDRYRSSGAFAPPVGLNFGDGFSSVFSPSAVARIYKPGTQQAAPIVELSFAGKLRGRPNAEAYIGRLRLGQPLANDPSDAQYSALDTGAFHLIDAQGHTAEYARAGSPFMLLPRQENERIINDGNGVYRARGVAWNRSAGTDAVALVQTVNGVPTNLLVDKTGTVERQSGLISYDSRLGGKVYLDPELGTVKFVGAVPNRNAEIRLSYTPTFLRVTPGGNAAYNSVNGLFDDRYVSGYDYWFTANGPHTSSYGNMGPAARVRNDRYYFAYGRGATGAITARPYSTTMRIGVRLPTRIWTNDEGLVRSIQVTGNSSPYQVDPANGRVYFQAEDEGKVVTIVYSGVNEATNDYVDNISVSASASFVLEKPEEVLPVDEAANDSALTAFLDPFTYASANNDSRERPPLVWLFYVSTRAGGPDVYFQTVAPRFAPSAK